MSEVTLLNDWDTIGIRGSGSTNVTMENVFIPDERIVGLLACNEGTQAKTFPEKTLYYGAFTPIMVGILAFPIIGLGKHMLEDFLETLPKRDIKLTPYVKAGEAAVTHLQVGEASSKVDAAQTIMQKVCAEIDACSASREAMPVLDRARLCRDITTANTLVWQGVDLLATAGGGSFARSGNIQNRIWSDVKVANMHPFVSRASNLELYGRILCCVEPLLMPI